MGQISFKISEKDLKFLRWYAEKHSTPLSSLYREITLDFYHNWRINTLIELYKNGEIGFKDLCNNGNLTFTEGMLLLQERKIEPPISIGMDKHTSNIRDDLIKEFE